MLRPTLRLGVAAAVGVAAVSLAPPVLAGPNACDSRVNNSQAKLAECVTLDGVRAHQAALQAIADANGGTRAAGTSGYEESVDYVVDTLEAAGWSVSIDEFDYDFIGPAVLQQLAPTQGDYPTGAFSGSGSGDVTAPVDAVDVNLSGDRANTSGCEAADFAGFPVGSIALVQRGTCNFGDKAYFAEQAGAVGVIIFNQGNNDGRTGLIVGTLGDGVVGELTIPVVGASYDQGTQIIDGASVSLSVDATITTRSTQNVIADLEGVNTDNVVMAGAHLDSVQEGPGINDNGSGSATILATALALGNNTKYTPQNSLRFAWWGAEESGLIGSTKYIEDPNFGISQEDYDALAAYLNFDMVGSPNFIYGVYDADESTFPAPVFVPEGSEELEDLFEAYYTINDIPYEDSEFSGRSDYQVFIDYGIPASGLFTGAEEVKTPEQEAIWGGIAGESFDQCYHQACDTIDNVSAEAIEVNVDAIAYAIYNLAASTELVNGVEGVDVKGITPDEVEFDGPQGTFAGGGGGFDAAHAHPAS